MPVGIIREYLSPVDFPHDDVMQGSWGVYTRDVDGREKRVLTISISDRP